MKQLYERLKEARKLLKLSQEFVAKKMKMSRTTIVAIEAGKRSISAEELDLFSKLYGVGVDELLHGNVSHQGRVAMFARSFSVLSDIDQQEIINLIDFKHRYKERMNG